MAGVPERGYESQVSPSGGAKLPRLPAEAFGVGLGREIEQAGQQWERRGLNARELELAREMERAQTQAGLAVSQFGADMDVKATEAKLTAAPDGGGYTEGLLKDFDKRRGEILEGVTNTRVRERVDLQLGQMRDRLRTQGGIFEAGARVAKTVNDATTMIDVAANRVRAGKDPAVLAEEFQNLDTTAEAWRLPPDKKEELLRTAKARYAQSFVEGLGPAQAQAVLDSGSLSEYLSPGQVEHLINRNETDLHRLEVEQRQKLSEERSDAITFLQSIEKRSSEGIPIPDEDFRDAAKLIGRSELRLEGHGFDIGKAETVDRVNRTYMSASPQIIDGRIKEIDARIAKEGDKIPPALVIERNRLAEILPTRTAQIRKDPLGRYAESGGRVSPIDWNNPATLDVRLSEARLAQGRQGGPLAVLTDEDAAGLQEQLANGNRAGRINVVNQLARGRPEFAIAAARQIAGGDHALQTQVALATMGRDGRAAARDAILGGDALVAHKSIFREQAAREIFAEQVPALRGLTPDAQRGVWETAVGIFATRRLRNGHTDWPELKDQDARASFRVAVSVALGAQRRPTGEIQGGIGEWGGNLTLLPTNMTQVEFNRAIARSSIQDFVRAAGVAPVFQNGQVPRIEQLKGLAIEAVGDGRYRVRIGRNYLGRADGRGVWEFDVRKLHRIGGAR